MWHLMAGRKLLFVILELTIFCCLVRNSCAIVQQNETETEVKQLLVQALQQYERNSSATAVEIPASTSGALLSIDQLIHKCLQRPEV